MNKCGMYSRKFLSYEIYQQVCDFNKAFFICRYMHGENKLYIKREDLFDVAYDLEKTFSFLLRRDNITRDF